MRTIIMFGLLSTICYPTFSQKYSTAAGIRLGSGIGVTVQQSLYGNKTLEAIVQKGFFHNETTITALFDQHNNLLSRGLNFYLGAGPHIGLYGKDDGKGQTNSTAFGASFIGGMEFKLGKVLMSFDYKPSINVTDGNGVFDSQAAVSLRYIFIKSRAQSPKWMFWKKKKQPNNK